MTTTLTSVAPVRKSLNYLLFTALNTRDAFALEAICATCSANQIDQQMRVLPNRGERDIFTRMNREVLHDFLAQLPESRQQFYAAPTRTRGSLLNANIDYQHSKFTTIFCTRVFWIIVLTVFGVFTSTFVSGQEELLVEVLILTAFIAPIIDMGGNTGSQSATLVLRSMALGQLRPRLSDLWWIVKRELPIAAMIAATVSVLELVLAAASKYDILFHDGVDTGMRVLATVSASMFVCTILGALIGATLPFLAKRIGADPATLSAPLITSIMDFLGVVVYFGIAALLLGHLIHG